MGSECSFATVDIHKIFRLNTECRTSKCGGKSHFASILLFLVLYSKTNWVCTCNKAYRFVVLHQSDELLTSVILGIEPRAPGDLCKGWYLKSMRRVLCTSITCQGCCTASYLAGKLIQQGRDMLIQCCSCPHEIRNESING